MNFADLIGSRVLVQCGTIPTANPHIYEVSIFVERDVVMFQAAAQFLASHERIFATVLASKWGKIRLQLPGDLHNVPGGILQVTKQWAINHLESPQ